MKKRLFTLILASVGMTLSMPQAIAQESSTAAKKAAAKPAAKKATSKSSAKKKAVESAAKDEDDMVPDIAGSTTVDYQCELGNKVTIYENQTDSQNVALRWNQKLHRLQRVSTTTGASRFENKKYGLVWIGIPAKGILLDSKKGQQLANECKSARQAQPIQSAQQDLMTRAGEVIQPQSAPQREQTSLASQ